MSSNSASASYCEHFRTHPNIPPFHHANWTTCENKVVWLQQVVPKLKDREWCWIDDEIEKWTAAIQQAGPSLNRCIQSNPEGRDERLILQATLTNRLESIRTNQGASPGPTEAAQVLGSSLGKAQRNHHTIRWRHLRSF